MIDLDALERLDDTDGIVAVDSSVLRALVGAVRAALAYDEGPPLGYDAQENEDAMTAALMPFRSSGDTDG